MVSPIQDPELKLSVKKLLLLCLFLVGCNSASLSAAEADSIGYYLRQHQDLKALKFAIAQSELLLRKKAYRALCENNVQKSRIYLKLNDTKKSVKELYSTLKIAEQQNLKLEQANIFNEIAKNFQLTFNRPKALYYFKKGEAIAGIIRNDTLRAFTQQGQFSIYVQSNKLDSARYYMESIMKIYKKKRFPHQLFIAHSNYSAFYFSTKEYPIGKIHLDSALFYVQKYKKLKDLNVCYSNLGYYYMVVEKNYKKGEEQYLKMLELNANDPHSMNNADCYLNLSYAYEMMGDYKKATECLSKYIEKNEVIFANKMDAQLRDADTKYAINNVESEYKQKQQQLEEVQSKNLKIFIVILALITIIAILFYFFNQNSRLKEKNKLKDIESKIQQNIINATIDGQEIERRKIASVLHDSISAQLSSAGLHLSAFSATNATKSDEITKTRAILKDAHDKVRDLSHELLPTLLAKFGLFYALQDLCEKNSNSLIEFEYDSEIPTRKRLNEEYEMKVYFIIAELLNNVIKHSDANKAKLTLTTHHDTLHIAITDNGKGFDTSKSQSSEGFGLTQIRARIANMKGKFTIDSKPGNGTTITIDIPVEV